VVGFNFGGRADDPVKFGNAGDEAWWNLLERFHYGQIRGTIDPYLIEDVTSRLRVPAPGHTHPHLEDKDKFRKRVGRSPDWGDGYALCFYVDDAGDGMPVGVE